MKTIGILSSGGDAPGMNAAIRAITRTSLHLGMKVKGIRFGYQGLMEGDIVDMDVSSVGDIIMKGGTMLGSARSKEFETEAGMEKALKVLEENEIEGLVVLGGDGSMLGAKSLAENGIKTACIPCTIDNDMGYTDFTIGFHTAVETVIESIGKLRDTSSSHGRANIIEVMGRHCGDIALYSGFAGGAESIVIPEIDHSIHEIADRILRGKNRGKRHHIIVVAEGAEETFSLRDKLEDLTDVEIKITILGHVQRGGSPSFTDSRLGSEMGYKAAQLLNKGESSIAIGVDGDELFYMPIADAVATPKKINEELYHMAKVLSN